MAAHRRAQQGCAVVQGPRPRTFFANVVRCEPDKQGRFLLPDDLRKYAGIQQEVYFLGQAGRAEIWAAERYEEEEANVSAEELAALMEEIGI